MNIRDADQMSNEYQATMGPDLGSAFYVLCCEVSWLYEKWERYVELFGVSQNRIVLLNDAAEGFFGALQRLLQDDITLHIARINDSSRSAGRPNLSLLGVVEMVTADSFKTALKLQATKSREISEFCRDARNRRLAHTDSDLAMRKPAKALDKASSEKFTNALTAIGEFLNLILSHYGEGPIDFVGNSGADDALELLCVVNDCLQLEDVRRSYIREGRMVPQNLRPRKI